ncbi:hypothetical protein [Persicitalea jodogahamensis]|uniref:Carboxypeptidase regulatory-like domain-containing protein n=1 Tax=Persicitalea jodogahamensis TaxID=402147 RepID=A0A8J3G7L2_9BACT|nr:hypothetical protein [Persicitalea jodogahamensis]GHB57450.1 hypothetical protein GCM10007390_08590 [Persicitalea jodogahamensis]
MKRSNYLLKIENPCPESWAEMSPTDSGRFCANCAKNVIDFTSLSDDQVLAILKKSSGNLCGRLEESQMNRFLVSNAEPSNKGRLFRLLTGLFLFSAAGSKAQQLIVREPMAMVEPPTQQEKFLKEAKASPHYSQQNWISGRVISAENKAPVVNAFVHPMAMGKSYLAATDDDGYFKLLVPDSAATREIRYMVIHPQSGDTTFRATIETFPSIIELSSFPRKSQKVISGGGLTIVKRKWWQFWKKKYCK